MKNKVNSIVLCVSHLTKAIEDYFGEDKKFEVHIEYTISEKPLATVGQLKTAEKFVNDTFVCMYRDSIFDFNLKKTINQHKNKKGICHH